MTGQNSVLNLLIVRAEGGGLPLPQQGWNCHCNVFHCLQKLLVIVHVKSHTRLQYGGVLLITATFKEDGRALSFLVGYQK